MITARHIIAVGERQVELLFTPAIVIEAKTRGVSIEVEDAQDASQMFELFLKLIFLSAHNARRVAQFDDPTLPELELSYSEVHIWGWQHQKEVGEITKKMIPNIFGTSKEGEGVKKK